jgi:hypothetical protein
VSRFASSLGEETRPRMKLLDLKNLRRHKNLTHNPESKVAPVIKKMYQVLHNLDLKKHKNQSIGIFVSPLLEKVYYFNYHTPPEDSLYKEVTA